jgi:tetratricopeptide (TPR) repeat protein
VLTLHEGGDAALADALIQQAHAHYLSVGLVREAGLLLYERTLCLMRQGRRADALAQAHAFERECLAAGDRHRRLKAINLQGVLLAELRRWGDAVDAYRRCVELAWRTRNHYWLGFALWNHGRNLARLRQPEAAALLMSFGDVFWRSHFGSLDASDARYVRQVRALVTRQLGALRANAMWEEGSRLTLPQAVGMALAGVA